MSDRDFQVTDVNITKEIRDLKTNVKDNKENRLLAGTGIHIDRTLNRTIITATGDTESKLQPIYLSQAEYTNMLAQGPDSFIEGSLYVVDNNQGIEDEFYIPLQPKYEGTSQYEGTPLYEMSIQTGFIRPQTTYEVTNGTFTRWYKLYSVPFKLSSSFFGTGTEYAIRTSGPITLPNFTLFDVRNAHMTTGYSPSSNNKLQTIMPTGFNVTIVIDTANSDKYILVTLDKPFETTESGLIQFELVYHNHEKVDE